MPGYKNFVTNQILKAEFVNDFLMNQMVIVCATEADRDSDLAAYLREGMMCYIKNLNQIQFYDGTDWVRLATYSEANTVYDPRKNNIEVAMEPIRQ